jgi:formamidopyrimidine-DNA glycosylase
MPELPEVETVCRELKPKLQFKKIVIAKRFRDNIRNLLPIDIENNLLNKEITDVSRQAKYILIALKPSAFLVFHLGMTGKLIVKPSNSPILKHDHFVITLEDDTLLVFNDARRFGIIDYFESHENLRTKYLLNIGAEPLLPEFNTDYLLKKLFAKKTPIKKLLMDNNIVVGIGNIYAAEILFKCNISPLRLGENITKIEAENIVKFSKIILTLAIELNGSSFRDYILTSGEKGGFQNHFFVYSRHNQQCKICTTNIAKTTQSGRTTFYCPTCQK